MSRRARLRRKSSFDSCLVAVLLFSLFHLEALLTGDGVGRVKAYRDIHEEGEYQCLSAGRDTTVPSLGAGGWVYFCAWIPLC